MAKLDYAGPNAEQIRYWNEQAGPKWVAMQELIDEQIAPLGRHAMDRARIAPGERVLDVGCGCGHTTLDLASRTGPTGSVVGLDLSTPMLNRARDLARAAGVGNVRFEEADAQTHAFAAGSYDVLFSRFGVMFFVDPDVAFDNLRRALRPGGRLAFVCWRAMPENPWMAVPLGAALQLIPPPTILAPGAPGPFAFADSARVRGVLERAGFAEVAIVPHDQVLVVGGGGDLDRTVDFLLQMGPTAAALREAGPAKTAEVATAVRDALRPYATPDGVRLGSASWMVTAVRP
jgi:SAM-dependent methyltransferase